MFFQPSGTFPENQTRLKVITQLQQTLLHFLCPENGKHDE